MPFQIGNDFLSVGRKRVQFGHWVSSEQHGELIGAKYEESDSQLCAFVQLQIVKKSV